MPHPTSAGDGRGRAGARLVPLEHNGQPRMDLGLRTKVRTVPDRHDNAEADTKVERVVVPRDNAAQCGRLTEQPMSALRLSTPISRRARHKNESPARRDAGPGDAVYEDKGEAPGGSWGSRAAPMTVMAEAIK